MPKPIVCLSDQLRRFLGVFRTCFTKGQWKYFVNILLALIECEERRTMTGLLRTIGERVSLSGLSRFLNKWPWSPDKLADAWFQRFQQRKSTAETCCTGCKLSSGLAGLSMTSASNWLYQVLKVQG